MKKSEKKKQRKWLIITSMILISMIMIGWLFHDMKEKIADTTIGNLSGTVSMVAVTTEGLMQEDGQAVERVAEKAIQKQDMNAWFNNFCMTNGMSGIVLTKPDTDEKIAESGTSIPVQALDFSENKNEEIYSMSASYKNSSGNWAYALKCPVMKGTEHIADVIAEYEWDHIYQSMTSSLYEGESSVMLFDNLSGRFVVQPDESKEAMGTFNRIKSLVKYSRVQTAEEKEMFQKSLDSRQAQFTEVRIDGEIQIIYMWPVNGGTTYLIGVVPTDAIISEMPIIRQSIFFGICIIVLCSCLVGITFGIFSIKEKREMEMLSEEREVHNQELQEALKKAEKANASKTLFLSNMSHDMRTPLNGIMGLLKIEETHPDDMKLVKENREKMKVSAEYLLSLVNDLLQMSKLEDGQISLTHEFMSLQELSADVGMIIGERAAERGITFTYDQEKSEENIPYVYTSPLHLRQLFLNIYINCIKYNRVGGTINTSFKCIEKRENTRVYEWIISDTGIGMSEEFQKHIFDPFSQESSDARSVYNGAGLGMSIVKKIVDALHGTIEVKSKKGEGSAFRIVLPFEIADPKEVEKAKKKETVKKDYSIKGMHLLVVEDNVLNAEIAEMLLRDQGARVSIAEDGKQAVEMVKTQSVGTFDAVLMDIMMPVMDGITATKTIRAMNREDAKGIPIIAMTANAFEEDEKRCLDAGMDGYLCKPLQVEKMVEVIATCCNFKTHGVY